MVTLERIPFCTGATPLDYLAHLSDHLGGPKVFFKREDLTGLGLGGNKVRKVEYLLGEARAKGANVVISTASIHSNFLRILTAACRNLGWRCRLIVRGKEEQALVGNYLCYFLMGAEIDYVETHDPFSSHTLDLLEQARQEEIAKGNTPYVIHLGSFSAPLATIGYVHVVDEIFGQNPDFFDHVILAVGSGTTYAGLKLGLGLNGMKTSLHGVTVNLPAELLAGNIRKMISGACEILGRDANQAYLEDIKIDERFLGEGYPIPSAASLHAVRTVAQTEGILLDPIYTGKAFAALQEYINVGEIRPDERVLFVHTGGMPNIFANEEAFERLRGDN